MCGDGVALTDGVCWYVVGVYYVGGDRTVLRVIFDSGVVTVCGCDCVGEDGSVWVRQP